MRIDIDQYVSIPHWDPCGCPEDLPGPPGDPPGPWDPPGTPRAPPADPPGTLGDPPGEGPRDPPRDPQGPPGPPMGPPDASPEARQGLPLGPRGPPKPPFRPSEAVPAASIQAPIQEQPCGAADPRGGPSINSFMRILGDPARARASQATPLALRGCSCSLHPGSGSGAALGCWDGAQDSSDQFVSEIPMDPSLRLGIGPAECAERLNMIVSLIN